VRGAERRGAGLETGVPSRCAMWVGGVATCAARRAAGAG